MDEAFILDGFSQCRVTSPFWSEPMRMGAKLRLKVGVENEAHDFLHQFIRPALNAKRTFPTILFGDVDASGGFPSIPLMPHSVNDGSDFVFRHTICGLLSCPFGHGSMVPIHLAIGHEIQVGIEQESIHAL